MLDIVIRSFDVVNEFSESRATWRRNGRETQRRQACPMSLRHVIVELPDRPGSLGQVTTLLGRLGVDIRQMRVLGRDGTVATDEFVVSVPGPVIDRMLPELIEEIQGVRVRSIEPTHSDSGISGAIVAV
ncbi:ACT domain-containing protein [Dactylosporangium sp. CA-139114]|uniref:ACT domain-containing protein n=1 Tax=Dactylosporangium sp. CA-139114 TaxID=3239931 RepID=UPI003D962D59